MYSSVVLRILLICAAGACGSIAFWSSAHADGSVACVATQGDERALCQRCVAETGGSSVPWSAAFGRDADKPFLACRDRMKAERAELTTIIAKANRWQPRGYQDAGDGLEGFGDEELARVPQDVQEALDRVAVIRRDLSGQEDTSDIPKAVAQISKFVAAEQACRADKKCMADRAAKRAEEAFRRDVVAPMCEADQGIEQAKRDIAQERANPAGVVDLETLHRLGRDLQYFQGNLAAGAPAYAKVRHHPWPGWRKECPP